jgi:ATP-independent RNA helicase DbpA
MTTFSGLPLSAALHKSLDTLGYADMTPVQAEGLPAILAGRDLIVQAPTGSGKTVAFALGLLHRLEPTLLRVQALVLCPTRELVDQVAKEIRRLASNMPNIKVTILSGGVPLGAHLASLRKDPHVVVGTPGRIQELLGKNALALGKVQTLVLDEADRMLDMGFRGADPRNRRAHAAVAANAAVFRDLSRSDTGDGARHLARPDRRNRGRTRRSAASRAMVFRSRTCQQAKRARRAADGAQAPNRPSCSATCGATPRPLSMSCRGMVLPRSRCMATSNSATATRCSYASPIAVAGCWSPAMSLRGDSTSRTWRPVVNYELPPDPDIYLHRIGRTGRAGSGGLALSLCASREIQRAHLIEEQQAAPLVWRKISPLEGSTKNALQAPMTTLRIDAGRSDKLRPGDILGALTGDAGLPGDAIGKIDIFTIRAYVAIKRELANKALSRLRAGRIKGRNFRVELV